MNSLYTSHCNEESPFDRLSPLWTMPSPWLRICSVVVHYKANQSKWMYRLSLRSENEVTYTYTATHTAFAE